MGRARADRTGARLRQWASRLKRQLYALYLASRDPRVPRFVKGLIVIALAYALSPIDLIPDFIPVLGYLDDLVLVPLLIWLALRWVPAEAWRDCRARAAGIADPQIPSYRMMPWVIGALWLGVLILSATAIWRAFAV